MIRLHRVSKQFRANNALNDIDLHIEEGKIVGLVGRNGAGKTTLLNLIAGFWKPTSGEIEVFGTNPFDSLRVSTNSIFIDDNMAFPESITLAEIFEVCQLFYPNWNHELAERLFAYYELKKSTFYYQLSKGQKSTFNAIVGIAARVPLTIFDEPTNGMDRSVRQDFYRALLKDYMKYPRTMIISSHHIEEMEHILERLILIDKGKLLLHKPMDDVREYALSITGEETKLRNWLGDREVLFEEKTGISDLRAIVKNEANLINEVARTDFVVSNIMAADLAVYLTKKEKGGIDRVFNEATRT